MEIMKIGDKVRFLSEVGGGVVTGFRGKDIVLVEDADGFDIPMPVRECVVIDADDYNIKRKPVAQKDVPDAAKSKGGCADREKVNGRRGRRTSHHLSCRRA